MPAHVFIATSLNGFIARPDGGIDWLPQPSGGAAADGHGYTACMAGIDAIVTYVRTQAYPSGLVQSEYRADSGGPSQGA